MSEVFWLKLSPPYTDTKQSELVSCLRAIPVLDLSPGYQWQSLSSNRKLL